MSPQRDDTPSAFDGPAASAEGAATRPLYWSVRRELWENRSLYVAPLAAAALLLLAFAVSMVGLPDRRRAVLALDPAKQAAAIAEPYLFAAAAITLTMIIVAVFYCNGAMHGERRDRSLLFWRSLPVSDFTTVLAKALIPILVLPLTAFAVILATQLLMLALSGSVLLVNGLGVAPPGLQAPAVQAALVLLYLLVTFTLWWAPIYGWLLMISAWARRAPFLWAVLPPLAVCLMEKVAFNTTYLTVLLGRRLVGSSSQALATEPYDTRGQGGALLHPLSRLDPGKFLSSPDLWIGLGAAAAFLAVAVWLRRRREPS